MRKKSNDETLTREEIENMAVELLMKLPPDVRRRLLEKYSEK